MKKLIIIVILSLGVSDLIAQTAPGYMGKKLFVEYSGSTAPAIFRKNQNGNKGFDIIPPEFNLPFNYGHKITLNYTLNRKSAIGSSFEMYNTGVDYEGTSIRKADYGVSSASLLSEESYRSFEGFGIAKIKGVSLFYQRYDNGIAPLGKHTNFGLKVLFVNTDLSNSNFIGTKREGGITETLRYIPPSNSISSIEWGVFYGLGVNRIIQDRILLSLGFELALIVSAYGEFSKDWNKTFEINENLPLSMISDGDYYENGVQTEEDLFKKMSSERVFSSQFFNIKIGIGFLAY